MSFTTYKRRVAIGWFRDIEESGKPLPGNRAIATRLDLDMEQVDRLLHELATEGLIELSGADPQLVRVLCAPGTLVPSTPIAAAVNAPPSAPVAVKEYPGASGTARKAPSVGGSPPAARTSGRAPSRQEPVAEFPPPAPNSDPQEPIFARGHKPRISAEIIRVARERGQPLDQFVTALIDMGFSEWRRAQAHVSR